MYGDDEGRGRPCQRTAMRTRPMWESAQKRGFTKTTPGTENVHCRRAVRFLPEEQRLV